VKRVIGLPGDTIDIRDGAVWVNGQKLAEKYTNGASEPYDLHPPVQGSRGLLFRDGATIAEIPTTAASGAASREKDIIGTPVMIYMSLNVFFGGLGAGTDSRAVFFGLRERPSCIPERCAGSVFFRTF